MLSNIVLRNNSVYEYYENYVFDFAGKSMAGIDRRALFGGERIEVSKIDAKEKLSAILGSEELFRAAPLFVISPYAGKEFIAAIKNNDIFTDTLTFEFINADKSVYPDAVFHISEIRAIYPVVQISKDLTGHLPCHCASDGEYCGAGCINESKLVKEVGNAIRKSPFTMKEAGL